MVRTLLYLIANRPELLLHHAEAYADLIHAEVNHQARGWMRSTLLLAAMLCCLNMAGVLAGVALLLWTLTPQIPPAAMWLMGMLPVLTLAAAAVCWRAASRRLQSDAYAVVRDQLKADIGTLRDAHTP